ncbi:MAG: aminoacetone oxidase family FAD-binding enzyme [Crocinitomicaceae bacterium]|nr:aminoacetone oxidase family FAD-binding enzyme [Crocinitomicaceae bacterium]
MKIAIVGGGAAGFFAALTAKEHFPNHEVTIFEKSAKALSKVKISGGGRCNVTHACFDNKLLAAHYPRGENYLKKAFEQFNAQSTLDWFKKRGVEMKTYPDGCIFPMSNDSQTIIDCFLNEAKRLGVKILYNQSIVSLDQVENGFRLHTRDTSHLIDKVIVTTGGQPKRSGLEWLEEKNHSIVEPVPSLFTFNIPDPELRALMGITVNPVSIAIANAKLQERGPLLITHWGLSGPAILKLSAFAARHLAEQQYSGTLIINWMPDYHETSFLH